jgi:GNAT superfamily N-acetyltransferase
VARYIVYESALGLVRPAAGVDLRWYRESDLKSISGHYVDMDYITDRLARGARIVVTEVDGKIAGWRFYTASPCLQGSCFVLHAPEDVIFGFAAFVLPAFRGRGLFKAISGFAAKHFLDAGYRRLVSMANHSNHASRGAHTRAGEEPVLEILTRGLLGFRYIRVRGRTHFGYWTRKRRFPVYLE